MKKLLLLSFITTTLFSCNPDQNTDGAESGELDSLKQQYELLVAESQEKDDAYDEYLGALNEIESNLDSIKRAHGYITSTSSSAQELDPGAKARIIEDINLLADLMGESQSKINRLNSQLKDSGYKNEELERMVMSRSKELEAQHLEILNLKEQLADIDAEFVELLDAYQEKTRIVYEQEEELNTAWYAFGTYKELKAKGIVIKEGSVIGLGGSKKLNDDFDKDYFQKIDTRKLKVITLASKKATLITSHPSGSYEFEGQVEKLLITKPAEFWGASKYLVIIVE